MGPLAIHREAALSLMRGPPRPLPCARGRSKAEENHQQQTREKPYRKEERIMATKYENQNTLRNKSGKTNRDAKNLLNINYKKHTSNWHVGTTMKKQNWDSHQEKDA